MRVSEVEGAAAFLEVAGPFLQRDEAVHCILLGIPGDFVRYGGGEGARFWVVEDGGGVLGAAMVTPPMSVSVSLMERDTVRALASALSAGDAEVRGVVGPAGVADAFDREWRTITGGSSEVVGAGQHAWELTQVNSVPGAAGGMVIAKESHLAALKPWSEGAAVDFGNTTERWEAQIERACGRGQLFLWRGVKTVAMAMLGGQTPTGIRVSGVYTPPEERRHGYATSLVAAMSAYAMRQGRERCFLFTDTRNATAEGVYRRIGYRQVGTISHHRFG